MYADDNVIYFNENSGDIIFSGNETGILSIDLNNINLDNSICDEDDPGIIIHAKILAWHSKFGKVKVRNKELNEEVSFLHVRR